MARRIAFDYDEIRIFPDGNRADLILPAHVRSAVESRNFNSFDGRESSLDQQLDLALIAKSRNDSSVAGGIRTSQQQSSGRHKFAFQFHVALELQRPVVGWWFPARRALSVVQISFARFGRHYVEHLLPQRRTPRNASALKNRQ